MHLLIPLAAGTAPAAAARLQELTLPNLDGLLVTLSATGRDVGDESSLSPPHERALARTLGLSGDDGRLPWAAYRARLDGIDPGDLAWGLLTPVHLHVGDDGVTLTDPHALRLDAAEARSLFEAVQPLLQSEAVTLVWGAPLRWYAAHESLADLPTASIDRVISRHIDPWLPPRDQARLLRRLQNEVQMLLYTHPVNEARLARGALPVNSFWLSGCGIGQHAQAARPPTVDDRLRAPALAGDWAAWADAWQALDAGPLRELLALARRGEPVRLTLAGLRHAAQWDACRTGWLERLRRRFTAPRAAGVLASL